MNPEVWLTVHLGKVKLVLNKDALVCISDVSGEIQLAALWWQILVITARPVKETLYGEMITKLLSTRCVPGRRIGYSIRCNS